MIEIRKRTTPHYPKDFYKVILLCVFLGVFGIHRFYTGYKRIGLFQMLTLGGCFVWWIIDIFSLCFNTYKDKYGNPPDDYNGTLASFVLTAAAVIMFAIAIMSFPMLV